MVFGKRADGAAHHCPSFRALSGLFRGVGAVRRLHRAFRVVQTVRLLPAPAQHIGGGIHRQPVQPCGELRVHAEAGQRLPGGEKGLLGGVLRVCRDVQHPQGQRIDELLVALHQHPERVLLAPLGAHHEDLFLCSVIGPHRYTSLLWEPENKDSY